MATFAERFKKIQNKYFDKGTKGTLTAPTSPSTLAAFESEVSTLFKEQEAAKEAQSPAPQGGMPNTFDGGGLLELLRGDPNQNNLVSPEDAILGSGLPNSGATTLYSGAGTGRTDMYSTLMGNIADIGIPEITFEEEQEMYEAEYDYSATTDKPLVPGEGGVYVPKIPKKEPGPNPDGNWLQRNAGIIGNIGAGVAPIASKLLARNSIKAPKRIDPTQYIPSVKSRWYDSSAIENKFMQNNASAINTLRNSTGDFESLAKAINSSTYNTNTGIGLENMRGQQLNMSEQGRIDALVSEANKINAVQNTQADIDLVTRQDKIAQIERGYTTGIGDDVGGIFRDIASSKLAKEIAAEKAKYATLSAK